MKTPTILLCSLLGIVAALPNGNYHVESNYKSSSSSFRNNELQHKNDDSGYYSKDGDIEGRFKPKVVSESEHTEYINPKLQYNARYNGYDNGRMTTYGQLDSNDNSYVTNGHGGYGSQAIGLSAANMGSSSNQAYSGSYGMSSGHQTYGSAKLRTLTNRLQEELTRQMQDTIYDQMSTGGYSSMSVSQKMQLLENELRRNLTDRMRNELQNEYGTQSIRGGQSYSIHGGHVESTANYDNQELADLTNQIETNLLNSLRENYRQYESRQSSSSHNSHSSSNMYMTTTTYRPYTHQTTYRNIYPALNNEYSSSQYNSQSSKIHYGPIQNPVSITNVVSNVQTDLNQKVNDMLMDVRQKYFSQNTHGLTNYDVLLDRLKNELRSNITLYIDEAIRRNYGQQQLKDGYMYSVGPNGQYSTNYNYNSRDLENLQRQLESNLLEKLNREFQTYQTRYEQSYGTSGSSSSMTSGSHNYGTTYGSDNYSNRPSSPNLAPLVSSGIKGNNNYYGSRGSYEANSASSSATIMQLQRQLQEQLSRQLQAAIRQNQYQYSGQTSSSNPQAYQLSYQQLSEELSRNLTRQLQEAMSSSNYQGSSSYSYGGSSLNDQQFANLKSTLQNELSRELQQGLSQSWSSHSSWSASSGYSTNYRPTRDSNNNYYSNGQYRSGAMIEGADCDHDDANPHTSHRHRRHIG